MRRPTPRDWKDASRASLMLAAITAATAFTYTYANVPPVPPTKGSLKTIVLRDLSWVAVTAILLLVPRLGETGPKCLERLAGTVLGGATGVAAALSHSPYIATLIAGLTGAAGDILATAGGFSHGGKMVGVSYCIVGMPAFGAFGQPRDWAVDGAIYKLSLERLASVAIGVGLVYVLSVVWFPRAASDEAFTLAEETVARLRELSVCAFQPAAVLSHVNEDDCDGGKDGVAPSRLGDQATAPGSTKDAYLARITTRSLAPTATDAGVRAAHITACEARLQDAAVARGRLTTALRVAEKEIVMGRLPWPALGGCGGSGGGGRPAPGADDGGGAAAAAVLPTPTAPQPPASSTTIAWRPVYFPTVGAASAAWLRRLAPGAFTRRALPSAQLAGVGTAMGAVARALWMVGDSAGGGFPSYLSACVKERYGHSLPKPGPGGILSEHTEAAGIVEELGCLVGACLMEVQAGLAAARATWSTGRVAPKSATTCSPADDPVQARWVALRSLQLAQKEIGQRRASFDRAEEATLAGVERLHARRRGGAAAAAASEAPAPSDQQQPPSPSTPGLPPPPPYRLPNTLEASAVRIRWLALLFGFNETRRALEELAAAVEALRDAVEAAAGGGVEVEVEGKA